MIIGPGEPAQYLHIAWRLHELGLHIAGHCGRTVGGGHRQHDDRAGRHDRGVGGHG